VRDIAKDPKGHKGRCVSVAGVISGWTIFADIDAIYQRMPDGTDPSSNGGRLGLSPPSRLNYPDGYLAGTVIGRVSDCQETRDMVERSDDPRGGVVMLFGYCHSWNGPYMSVNHVQLNARARITRQLARANADYGDLEPAPADWPHTERVHSLAALFLSTLRRRDADALAALHFPKWRTWSWEGWVRPMLHLLLKDPKSPFADIRRGSSVQSVILLEGGGGTFDDDYQSIICFCRRVDGTGRWPIASFDADNLPTRPYACTKVYRRYGTYDGTGAGFSTRAAEYGLPEPP
jgi:hypothetical protein